MLCRALDLPTPGEHEVNATFTSIARHATTDVHVLHNGKPLHDGGINIGDHGGSSSFTGKLTMKAGDRLDFVVGFGNGNYGGDTTALAATVRQPDGTLDDAAAKFTLQKNPNGPWSYGWLAAAAQPDEATFKAYTVAHVSGGLPSRPSSTVSARSAIPDQRSGKMCSTTSIPYRARAAHRLRHRNTAPACSGGGEASGVRVRVRRG